MRDKYATDGMCDKPKTSERPPIERLAKSYGVSISEVIPLIGANEAETAANIRQWVASREDTAVTKTNARRRYGYTEAGLPIAEEQRIIGTIVSMWVGGYSLRTIRDKINADGHRTSGGKPWKLCNLYALIRKVGHDRDN